MGPVVAVAGALATAGAGATLATVATQMLTSFVIGTVVTEGAKALGASEDLANVAGFVAGSYVGGKVSNSLGGGTNATDSSAVNTIGNGSSVNGPGISEPAWKQPAGSLNFTEQLAAENASAGNNFKAGAIDTAKSTTASTPQASSATQIPQSSGTQVSNTGKAPIPITNPSGTTNMQKALTDTRLTDASNPNSVFNSVEAPTANDSMANMMKDIKIFGTDGLLAPLSDKEGNLFGMNGETWGKGIGQIGTQIYKGKQMKDLLQTKSDIELQQLRDRNAGGPTGLLYGGQSVANTVFDTSSANYNPQAAALALEQQQQLIGPNKKPVFKSRFTG